ncbi:T9SS type A sorting domain-containing protein [candidate division KSB1 bacterium]|nr:T9SS type A sorting domain-containing protein [candidate division KSB1 bacterium]
MRIFIILHMVSFSCLSYAAFPRIDPCIIGYSNSPAATAKNNGRRIVRDSNDNLVVFYQDMENDRPVIKIVKSQSGEKWSEPQFFAHGWEPSAAISQDDTVYIVYASENRQHIVVHGNGYFELPLAASCHDPDIDVTPNFVQIVWHQTENGHDNVYTKQLSLSLNGIDASPPVRLNADSCHAICPTVEGRLEYNSDELFVFWSETANDGIKSIKGCLLYKEITPVPINLGGTDGMGFPSISSGWGSEFCTLVCCDLESNALVTGEVRYLSPFAMDGEEDEWILEPHRYPTADIPYPSADDVISPSCAVVWQDNDRIFYNQTALFGLVDETHIQIGMELLEKKHFPNVCYKQFRLSYFDMVWTQGDRAPYKIMYQRAPKSRLYISWADRSEQLPDGRYLEEYGDYLTIFHYEKESIDWPEEEKLPKGLGLRESIFGSNVREIFGIPEQSGVFEINVTVNAGYPVIPFHTTFLLKFNNEPPVITSNDVFRADRGTDVFYRATAFDSSGNPLYFQFLNLPAWLFSHGDTISGTVPQNAQDTSFTFIASDGDMADTLEVRVEIIQQNTINTFSNLPSIFDLRQNFPNPFNPETVIHIQLQRDCFVNLSVFNLSGQKVVELLAAKMSAGVFSVVWDATGFPSGTYFYRLSTDTGFEAIKKLVLLK